MIKYTYAKKACLDTLKTEITNSAIIIALDYIELIGETELNIYFKSTLSGEDQTLLDGIVNNHDSTIIPSSPPLNVVMTDTSGKPNTFAPSGRLEVSTAFEIDLEYNYFKNVVLDKMLLWQYTETDNVYNIFAVDSNIKYNTIIDKNKDLDNKNDFEANYMADINRPLILSGTAYQSKFKGYIVEVPENALSAYIDVGFDDDIYLSKVFPVPVNAEFGDYVGMDILLKENDYKIKSYAETLYLYGTNPRVWIEGSGAGKVPNVCKMRLTYYNSTTTAKKLILWFEILIK